MLISNVFITLLYRQFLYFLLSPLPCVLFPAKMVWNVLNEIAFCKFYLVDYCLLMKKLMQSASMCSKAKKSFLCINSCESIFVKSRLSQFLRYSMNATFFSNYRFFSVTIVKIDITKMPKIHHIKLLHFMHRLKMEFFFHSKCIKNHQCKFGKNCSKI